MGLLINLLDDISKQQYVEKGKNYLNCTKQGITSEEYRIPNNAKDSATYLWGNLLQTKPCDDMHTFIVTFMPQNCLNSVVRVRFSNHPCGPLSNWKKYETIGEPNKRIDIYFYNGKDSNIPTDSNENNLINNAHLYSDEDIAKLCMALSNLFLNGTFVHPFISQQPIQENNKQINTNKNIMKINESQLRKIIQESVKNVLSELDWKTAVNAANKSRKKVYDLAARKGLTDIDVEAHSAKGPDGWRIHRGNTGHFPFTSERDGRRREDLEKELKRRIAQSDRLANYANKKIKDRFGGQSYYNNYNGVGNEFPELRMGQYHYDPELDKVSSVYPDYYYQYHYRDEDMSDMPKDFQDKAKEMGDFHQGKYDYTPEKGWHLKESKLNNIIKESIKKVLGD